MKLITRNGTGRSSSWRSLAALISVGSLLFLGACATQVVNQTTPFNAADYAAYDHPGTGTIDGHAFVRVDTGNKRGGAGIPITVVPLTAYTEERAKIMESGKEPAPPDGGLAQFTKSTVGDWGGSYAFHNLAAGKYLVFAKIKWEALYPAGRARNASGDVWITGRTDVGDGQTVHLVVTNATPAQAAQR